MDFLITDLGGGRFNALLVLEVKGGIVKFNGQQNCWTQDGHVMKGFGKYPIAMISKDTGQTSAEHVNVATIRNFKGLESNYRKW